MKAVLVACLVLGACKGSSTPATADATADASGNADAMADASLCQGQSPRVTTTTPADGATGVSVGIVPTATYDLAVMPPFYHLGTGDYGYVSGPDGGLPGDVRSLSAYQVKFFYQAQLQPNATYTATLHSMVGQNHCRAIDHSWSFTTGPDDVGPRVNNVFPWDGEQYQRPDVYLQIDFDEPVGGVDTTSVTLAQGGTPIAGDLSGGSFPDGETRWIFTPNAPLAAASTFTVTLSSAIHDAYGNAFAGYSSSFSTQ